MKINLHIERLIVDDVGISPQQSSALKAAVESALRQQLLNQGINTTAQQGVNRATVAGGSIAIDNSQGTDHLGQQIGQAVYQGIESQGLKNE